MIDYDKVLQSEVEWIDYTMYVLVHVLVFLDVFYLYNPRNKYKIRVKEKNEPTL